MMYFLTVNYNSSRLIEKLIASLPGEGEYELLVVNNSADDRAIYNLQSSRVRVIASPNNLGFGKACNLGLDWIYERDSQSLVWLINPDAYLLPESLTSAREFLIENPEVGILGTEVYEPDGSLWFGWGYFNRGNGEIISMKSPLDYEGKSYKKVEWVTGCSLIINLVHFSAPPQFDHDYFLYCEDFDFCKRYAREGYVVAMTGRIKVIHSPSSITLRYGYLQLTQNIYSYLLSLEKHTSFWILYGRFLRMIFMSLIVLPVKPRFSLAKLAGIKLYGGRLISQYLKRN
ncbi:MAG: hypothetical protein N5P05_001871 [Chroococcopsis gigantea SAG 12.99]|jgi:N-acetylglucosaminyl-diphospho-decaprenol L-rhamnosyltransferase|nr:glycosyltransferase family 2 protein [Chlorogloea purpurea SAG 13.99]MDV3000265.1 hypothetical protein [Chroococcopsis gigantea SAG 12.99]